MEEHDLDRILEQIKECDTTKPYIFISYTSANNYDAWSDALELQKRGYNVWLDEKNIDKTKKEWREDCIEAIKNMYCAMVFFYLSEYSITSKNCLDEMRTIEDNTAKKRHNGKPVPLIPIDVDPISSFVAFTDSIYEKIYHDLQLPYEEKNQKVETLAEMKEIFFPKGNDRVRIRSRRVVNRHPSYYSDIISQLQKHKIKPLYAPQPKNEPKKDEKKDAARHSAKTTEKTSKDPQPPATKEQEKTTQTKSAEPTQPAARESEKPSSSDGREVPSAAFAESLQIADLTDPTSPADQSEQDEKKEIAFPLKETPKDHPPAIIIEDGEDTAAEKPESSQQKDPVPGKKQPSTDPDAIAKKYDELSRQFAWSAQTRQGSGQKKDEKSLKDPQTTSVTEQRDPDLTQKSGSSQQQKTETGETPSSADRYSPMHYHSYEEYAKGVDSSDDDPVSPYLNRIKKRKRRKSISRWAVFLQLFAAAAAVTVFVVTNAVSLIPLDLISPISFSATSAFFVFLAFYVFSAISTGLTVVNIKQYSHTPKVKNRVGFLSCILLMAGITTVAMICGKAAFKEASGTAARFAITPFLFWLTNVIYLSFSDDLSEKCTKRFMIFGALRNFITVVLFFFLLQTDIPHFWVAVLLAVPSLLLIWGSTKTEMDNSDTYFTGIPLLLFWLMFRIACYVLLGEHDGFWMNLLAALGYNLPTFLISLLCIFLSTSI